MKKILTLAAAVLLCAACIFTAPLPRANAAETSAIATYYARSQTLMTPPTVVTRLNSSLDLEAFAGRVSGTMVRPSNLIVPVDAEMNVLDENGAVMMPFAELYQTYLRTKIIPLLAVNSEAAAQSVISFLNETEYADIGVLSSDVALVDGVRRACPAVRGVWDLSAADIGAKTAGKLVIEANTAGVQTIIFGAEQVSEQFIFDVQARFKTVWLALQDESEFSVYSAVSKGAYGLIADDYAGIYECYASFDQNSLARAFMNIGHRGLPEKRAENTLEGCIAAYESGATHVEIDAKICKSGEIVIMHDDGVETTTDGSGSIYNMTLEELKELNVIGSDGTQEPCKIPTLREIFEYFKGKDIVLVVEIKTEQENFATAFRDLLEECDMWEQVVSISFSVRQLQRMRAILPEIPIADLNSPARDTLIENLIDFNTYTKVSNPSKSALSGNLYMTYNLIARGFPVFYWTQYTPSDTANAAAEGCTGITTNHADSLGNYVKFILPEEGLSVSSAADLNDAEFSVKIIGYNRTEAETMASVFACEISETGAEVILQVKKDNVIRYSAPVWIAFAEDTPGGDEPSDPVLPDDSDPEIPPEESDSCAGCGGALAAEAGAAGMIAIITAMSLMKINKRKGEKR